MPHNPLDLEWQRRYEENDTPWDKGQAAPPLAAYLLQNKITGRVLVPGCGKGHDVLALAAQDGASVTGLDLAPTAIARARELAQKVHAGSRVNFITGNFFQLSEDLRGSFDWLVEHTCFCALDPQQRDAYVAACAFALKPGGKIFGIFYLTPDVESGPPFAVAPEELSRLFAPFFDLIEEWVPRESFPGREERELVRILQKR